MSLHRTVLAAHRTRRGALAVPGGPASRPGSLRLRRGRCGRHLSRCERRARLERRHRRRIGPGLRGARSDSRAADVVQGRRGTGTRIEACYRSRLTLAHERVTDGARDRHLPLPELGPPHRPDLTSRHSGWAVSWRRATGARLATAGGRWSTARRSSTGRSWKRSVAMATGPGHSWGIPRGSRRAYRRSAPPRQLSTLP